MMFRCQKFEKYKKNIVLKFYTKLNGIETFSYENLCVDSLNWSMLLKNVIREEKNFELQDEKFCLSYNVIVLLPVHSPALLPAIVG